MKRLEIGALMLAIALGVAALAGCNGSGTAAVPVGSTIPAGAVTPSPSPSPSASPTV
jgi:hypothetical protein